MMMMMIFLQLGDGIPASQAISRWSGSNGWCYLFREYNKTLLSSNFSEELSPLLEFKMSSAISSSSCDVQKDHPADGAGTCPVG
jgi:hypothetical protein